MTSQLRLDGGGTVTLEKLVDGRYDLSVIAPEGPSAAVYATRVEMIALAGSISGLALHRPKRMTDEEYDELIGRGSDDIRNMR